MSAFVVKEGDLRVGWCTYVRAPWYLRKAGIVSYLNETVLWNGKREKWLASSWRKGKATASHLANARRARPEA